MDTRNHEHYKDKTAHDAIKAADKPPNAVRETVENMRREANKRGDSIGKVSPDPVLRYASGDKRAEEARKNDRRKAMED